MFIRGMAPGAAIKLFERVRASVELASCVHEGERLSVTLSCGVVACTSEDENIDSCSNRAASALDEAEATGGNRVVMRG